MHFSTLHGRVVVPPRLPGLGDLAGGAAKAIQFPHDVLDREDLSSADKRALLAAWASDAYAVESFPTLRHMPGTPFPVTFSAIKDALAELDRKTLGADCAWQRGSKARGPERQQA